MGLNDLASLEPLFDAGSGAPLPLPPELAALYGTLRFPRPEGRPWVFANFVSTMDGVVTLGTPGHADAGEISGHNALDLAVMGLLRAAADAVIVGAGTLRLSPLQLFTPGYVQPLLDKSYGLLRDRLGKSDPPLTVIVTSGGDVDLGLPVFRFGRAPVLIVTTRKGEAKIRVHPVPPGVRVSALADAGSLRARAVLDAVASEGGVERIVVEGGPRLLGGFLAEDCIDELFLTLAPQVAGRDAMAERPGFVAGRSFAPEHPCWTALVSAKRAGSHLFLRYAFRTAISERP
jgi:riboflavin biosynthesis pyrimidine reductase